MSYSKENLEKLTAFIEELIADPENRSWAETLREKIDSSNVNALAGTLAFDEFVRLQKKIFRLKSKEFYKEITDIELKAELERDYQEMLWWRMLNNVERQYLYSFFQIENMLNYYIVKNDAFKRIQKNKEKYIIDFDEKFSVNAYTYFFYNNTPKEISKINSIYAKLAFWGIETNNKGWLMDKTRKDTIDQIVQIRNKASHRHSMDSNKYLLALVERFKSGDDSNQSFITNVLRKIRDSVI